MLNVYNFIASNWILKETPLAFGMTDIPSCSSNLVCNMNNFKADNDR